MNTTHLLDKFARIGARVKVADRPSRRFRSTTTLVTLDIQSDRNGEFFEVVAPKGSDPEVAVLDVQAADRHLLLMVKEDGGKAKHKFLCGHDERHWFVAAVPESAPVGTVRQAMEALKPAEVQTAQALGGLPERQRNRRKNDVFRRQGEWFFLPAADLEIDPALVLRNEPLRRGNGGKPHWAEFCYRTGGETVHFCNRYSEGVSEARFQRIIAADPEAKTWYWRVMRRNPQVHVRGRIRHADHKTITLNVWHQVVMNTEGQAQAMRNVAFLD